MAAGATKEYPAIPPLLNRDSNPRSLKKANRVANNPYDPIREINTLERTPATRHSKTSQPGSNQYRPL